MHEYSVMAEIVRRVLEEAADAGAAAINSIDLEIGGLTFLAEDQLRTAYDALVRGTIAEDSELHITAVVAGYRCLSCGQSGDLAPVARPGHNAPLVECPACGEPAVLEGGKECRVTRMEIEVPDTG